jgi:hypothetical protein
MYSTKLVNMFITGTIFGIALCVGYMFITGNGSFMFAAGVGTGSADINVRYLDGYGISTTAAANKVYISDSNGYLPQVIPTGMINMFDTSCPTGWTRVSALDGKFLAGGASYSATAGGSDSITLSVSQLPSHTHTGTTGSDGAHTHNMSTGTSNGSYYNNVTYSSVAQYQGTMEWSSAGAHTHTFTTAGTGSGASIDNRPAYATVILCKKD